MSEGHPPDRVGVVPPLLQVGDRLLGELFRRAGDVPLGGGGLHVPVEVLLRVELGRVARQVADPEAPAPLHLTEPPLQAVRVVDPEVVHDQDDGAADVRHQL